MHQSRSKHVFSAFGSVEKVEFDSCSFSPTRVVIRICSVLPHNVVPASEVAEGDLGEGASPNEIHGVIRCFDHHDFLLTIINSTDPYFIGSLLKGFAPSITSNPCCSNTHFNSGNE